MVKIKIKKLLAIVVLGLLSACSNKIDKAIEKCADFQIISESNTYLRNQFSYLASNDQSYINTVDEIKSLKKAQVETNAKYDLEYNKWLKKNPRPKIPTYNEVQQGYKFKKYYALKDKWQFESDKITEILLASWNKAKNQIEDLKEDQIMFIKISARENLEKISLKEKSLIHRYNKYFEKCEKAQKETPKSFMLEWSK